MNPRPMRLRSVDGLLIKDLPNAVKHIDPVLPLTFKKWMLSVNPPSWQDFGDLLVTEVNKRDVWDYIDDECERIARHTVKKRVGYICGMWNRLVRRELIDRNPWSKLFGSKAWKFDIKKYPYREWNFYKPYHKDPLFLLLYFHGFRIGEIAGIMPEDVVVDEDIMYPHFNLRHYLAPLRRLKNDMSERQVPVHPFLLDAVREWKAKDMFPFSIDRKGPGNSWSEMFRKNLGLPEGEAAHSIRHNFITRTTLLPVQPKLISRLVGHKPQNMTAEYGTIIPKMMHEVICKIEVPAGCTL